VSFLSYWIFYICYVNVVIMDRINILKLDLDMKLSVFCLIEVKRGFLWLEFIFRVTTLDNMYNRRVAILGSKINIIACDIMQKRISDSMNPAEGTANPIEPESSLWHSLKLLFSQLCKNSPNLRIEDYTKSKLYG